MVLQGEWEADPQSMAAGKGEIDRWPDRVVRMRQQEY